MKEISLEEIWNKYREFTKGPNLPGMVDLDYFKQVVNLMICEGISQALELAAENAYCTITLHKDLSMTAEQNKQSILDTIKQIK